MYKLFTDKSELFECDIKLQGASLKKSKARLVVETPDYALMFNGLLKFNLFISPCGIEKGLWLNLIFFVISSFSNIG